MSARLAYGKIMKMARANLTSAKRVVVKVGSSSISGENADQIGSLVDGLAKLYATGSEVVLVTSGSISTGIPLLKMDARPDDLITQQAAAAVGQIALMHRYQEELSRFSIVGAQVLLTAGDMLNTTHKSNAKQAMLRMLGLGVLPIVNENDTVATHEIRFGDNDHLAALVSGLLEADVLVLLSDTDALYTKPPKESGAARIATVAYGSELEGVEIRESGSGWGTGGAVTKVAAARLAADAGTGVLLTATARFEDLISGADIGTWFEPGAVS